MKSSGCYKSVFEILERLMFKIFIILCCLLGSCSGDAEKPKVCLNMIVKNESAVIERCLGSVKPFIDYWVIVDTGSSDGTQKIIKEFMKDIPGELHERPWVNFEYNRNEALELAKPKGDFVFFIDADEYLKYEPSYKLPKLDHNAYCIKCHCGGYAFARVHIVKSEPGLRWKGVLHEYLDIPNFTAYGMLTGIDNISTTEGARGRDPAKLLRDAMVLEEELVKDPNNARHQFYLAQSYMAHGDKEQALIHYKKRLEMKESDQELYDSMLNIVLIERELGSSDIVYRDALLKLFRTRPSRVEPLYYLSQFYRAQGDYQMAYLFARLGLSAPPTTDMVNVHEWISQYGLIFELSIAAYWVGEYEQSMQAIDDLLSMSMLPKEYRDQTLKNKEYTVAKLNKDK